MNKDVSQLVRKLRRAGCTVRLSKGQHVIVHSPDGERVCTMPSTPSDGRSIKNAIAQIRKGGIEI